MDKNSTQPQLLQKLFGLLERHRSAFWSSAQFQALWTRTPDNWLKKESFLIGLSNSIAASARI